MKDFKRNSPSVKIQHECDTVTSTTTKYISSAMNPMIIDIYIYACVHEDQSGVRVELETTKGIRKTHL